ncbi:hypothetical protein JCM11641_007924 [Rhodosporidiobolus odoratus]
MPSQEPNLDEIYSFAVQLAKDAGQLILDGSNKRSQPATTTTTAENSVQTKKNRVDLVTETDQSVENFIKERIAQTYPDFKFIGEESFAGGERVELTDEPTFIVDPIDGTTNFVHGLDFVCCSIGFTYKQIPVIGVIYNPFLSHLYHALTSHGAYRTNTLTSLTQRLPLAPPLPLASLGDAVIGVEWGSDRSKKVVEKKGRTFMRLAGDGREGEVEGGVMAHSLRSIGSAALNYSMVACGQLDLYWEIGCWSWDVCAGTVIAREAGGKVYGKSGTPFQPQDLMGHHFFVVRAIADTVDEKGEVVEKGEEGQDRIARRFFEVAEEY